MSLTKEDRKDIAEIVGSIVAGVLDGQKHQLPLDPSDPRHQLQAWRRGGAPHDVRKVTGLLALIDGSSGSHYHGSGKVIARVAAELEVDYTKHPSGLITNLECDFAEAIAFYDREFRAAKSEAYAASVDSPEHAQALEKERIKFVQANRYFRCHQHLLNTLIAKSLDDADVRLVFAPDTSPTPIGSVPAAE
jgi:hypothetical protein